VLVVGPAVGWRYAKIPSKQTDAESPGRGVI
jgi:hypothetical protein